MGAIPCLKTRSPPNCFGICEGSIKDFSVGNTWSEDTITSLSAVLGSTHLFKMPQIFPKYDGALRTFQIISIRPRPDLCEERLLVFMYLPKQIAPLLGSWLLIAYWYLECSPLDLVLAWAQKRICPQDILHLRLEFQGWVDPAWRNTTVIWNVS